MAATAGTERSRRDRGGAWAPAAPAVHAEKLEPLRPTAEPSSPVTAEIVRVDEVTRDGVLHTGLPELVLHADQTPLALDDVDALIARLVAARARMVALTPDPPVAKHPTGTERP